MAGFEVLDAQFDGLNKEVQSANSRFAELLSENAAYKAALADCRHELEATRKMMADMVQESEKRAVQAEKAVKALSSLTASLERAKTKHGQWMDGHRRLEALRAAAPDGEIKGLIEDVQLVLSGEPDAVEMGECQVRSRLKANGNLNAIFDRAEFEKNGLVYLHDDDFTRRGIDVGGKGAQKIEGFARKQ